MIGKTLFQLFISFTIIGFTSFGGLSMIPLINDQMLSHGWMTQSEVADIVAIAEMTPGPLGINCATFAGMRAAGLLGAIVSAIGVLMPALTVTVIVAYFFERFKKSKGLMNVMVGIRPATIGMIAGVLVSLALTNYVDPSTQGISYISIIISAIDIPLLVKWKIDVPIVIAINAAAGLLLFGYFGLS